MGPAATRKDPHRGLRLSASPFASVLPLHRYRICTAVGRLGLPAPASFASVSHRHHPPIKLLQLLVFVAASASRATGRDWVVSGRGLKKQAVRRGARELHPSQPRWQLEPLLGGMWGTGSLWDKMGAQLLELSLLVQWDNVPLVQRFRRAG